MIFSEKLLTLRKAKGITQEQLAEKLDVTRQSISKWESGQSVPELEKIVALSTVFDVSTDCLLKSSEIDDLSVKTEMLEKQQQQMLVREQRQRQIWACILYTVAVYLVFFAICFVEHDLRFSFEPDVFGKPVILAEFFIATAVVIVIWVRKLGKRE